MGMDDLKRLRQEYQDRERRFKGSDRYSLFNPSALFIYQERQRQTLRLLKKNGITTLEGLRILELGCGKGDVLREYLGYGAYPDKLHGTDLIPDRVVLAHRNLPCLPVTCADGQNLPYISDCFDLVLQYTVFSSILDTKIKENLAGEMLRVLKPDGFVIWYDFWINPTNRQTRGIRAEEIHSLFPGSSSNHLKLTLAPPLARFLVPISRLLADLIVKTGFLNTHYMVVLTPNSKRDVKTR